MSKKAAGAVSGVCLLLGAFALSIYNFLYKYMTGQAPLPKALRSVSRLLSSRADIDQNMISTSEGGSVVGILTMLAVVVILVGLLSERSVITAAGAGLGVLIRLLASLGIFALLTRSRRMGTLLPLRYLKSILPTSWLFIVSHVLLLLFFAALLIAALNRKNAKLFGILAAVLIFSRGLLLTMVQYTGYRVVFRFEIGLWTSLAAVLLAAGAVFAGISLAEDGKKSAAGPIPQPGFPGQAPMPYPPPYGYQPPNAYPAPSAYQPPNAYPAPNAYPMQEENVNTKLERLTLLLEKGIITQEEFEAKKKQLLGR